MASMNHASGTQLVARGGSFFCLLLLATVHLAVADCKPSCDAQAPTSESGASLLQLKSERKQQQDKDKEQEPGNNPHVCILARTCGPTSTCSPDAEHPERVVRSFLASVSAQTYAAWELHLINGQGGGEVFQPLVKSLEDPRISVGPSAIEPFATNSWGYEATNFALEQMLPSAPADVMTKHTQAPCEYFLITNADNLYARHFLETGLPGMLEGKDLLGFNFVTRYAFSGNKANEPMVDPGFQQNHIDLGSVLVSTKAIVESGLRFDPKADTIADWRFFEAILQRPGSKGTAFYNELQYIHQ